MSGSQSFPESPVSKARRWACLAVLSLAVMLLAIDMTVLNLTLPAIGADLRPTGTELLWIVDVYGMVIACLLISMGTLGDRIGRRRLLLLGSIFFAAASLMAALSTSPLMLIIARALQGVGGATLMPSTLSLIKYMFTDPDELGRAVSTWVAMYALGATVGPLLGGFLLEHFGWGAVFLINLPVVGLIVALGLLLLPESRAKNPGAFDLPGAGLSIVLLFATIGAVKALTTDTPWWLPLALLLFAVAMAWLLKRHLSTADSPLIDLDLLRSRPFSAAVLVATASMFILLGVMLYISQYLQIVLGLSPIDAGLILVPGMLTTVVVSVVTGRLLEKLEVRWLLTVSLLTVAAGLVMQVIAASQIVPSLSTGDAAVGWWMASFVILGLGIGLIDPIANTIILGAAPPDRSGAASAMSETGYELGGAFGIAMMGSVLVGTYTHLMGAEDLGFVGEDAAGAAGDVNVAHAVAESLPADEASRLIALADSAFLTGMELTAIFAVVFTFATLALVRKWIPKMRVADVTVSE
ncbi:MFS transporter [Corynebacterium sp. TAE3-ERU12]|uniref:MFS transporter n=1 Tax=Corynebacterium sp. TAE3-ERU12 TaxID=2849491 RepID=UPI001C4737B1|nr:MFS transporter [Corynebacterium sp. TAE3-ERU12]MBV7296198.1 MFS transporter [Corynebacterium sp. TAE3-ERU12]